MSSRPRAVVVFTGSELVRGERTDLNGPFLARSLLALGIEPIDAGRTRMSIESRFQTAEALERVLAMGMKEGLTEAVGQIDAILAEDLATTGDER